MAKDHDKGATHTQALKDEESITLPIADVEMLQDAAKQAGELKSVAAASDQARVAAEAALVKVRERLAHTERDLERERARSTELSGQTQTLLGDLASIQAQLSEATTPTKDAAEAEPLRAGHRRVITLQAYRFDTAQGPKSCPRGTVMQVPEKEFAADRLMRFPRLKDHGVHSDEVARAAKRDAMPVDHASRNLEAVHARVADVMRIREQQRDDLARRLTSPDHIATQLPG